MTESSKFEVRKTTTTIVLNEQSKSQSMKELRKNVDERVQQVKENAGKKEVLNEKVVAGGDKEIHTGANI